MTVTRSDGDKGRSFTNKDGTRKRVYPKGWGLRKETTSVGGLWTPRPVRWEEARPVGNGGSESGVTEEEGDLRTPEGTVLPRRHVDHVTKPSKDFDVEQKDNLDGRCTPVGESKFVSR